MAKMPNAVITTSIDAELAKLLDEWALGNPRHPLTRPEAVAAIIEHALSPLAVDVEGVERPLAQRWQVFRMDAGGERRACLELTASGGQRILLALSDAHALHLASILTEIVQDGASNPH
jgi:hypothetical protein